MYTIHQFQNETTRRSTKGKFNDFSRILILLSALILIASFNWVVRASATNDIRYIPASSEIRLITIHEGDSLWSIADTYAPKRVNIRNYIKQLKKANGLETNTLYEGELLVIP